MTEVPPAAGDSTTRCYGLIDMKTPLIPDREHCKTAKPKPVCDACGCHRKSDKDDHLFGKGEGVVWNCKQQSCCCFGIFFFVYFILFGIIQWGCFHFATINCGSLPEGYNYPGGGYGKLGGPEKNLLPKIVLIEGREPSIYGEAFDVFNSTDQAAKLEPVGTWFRTWGPWFYTYTYQDVENSKATVYMRQTLLSMTGAVRELKAMRCDGTGSELKITEGLSVFSNMVREFLRTNKGSDFKMLVDGEEKGIVEEKFYGTKSALFRPVEANKNSFANLIEQGTNNNGFNQWYLKNSGGEPVPYWMTSAVAVNYAFKIHTIDKQKDDKKHAFLAGLYEILSPTKADSSTNFANTTIGSAGGHVDNSAADDAQMEKV